MLGSPGFSRVGRVTGNTPIILFGLIGELDSVSQSSVSHSSGDLREHSLIHTGTRDKRVFYQCACLTCCDGDVWFLLQASLHCVV